MSKTPLWYKNIEVKEIKHIQPQYALNKLGSRHMMTRALNTLNQNRILILGTKDNIAGLHLTDLDTGLLVDITTTKLIRPQHIFEAVCNEKDIWFLRPYTTKKRFLNKDAETIVVVDKSGRHMGLSKITYEVNNPSHPLNIHLGPFQGPTGQASWIEVLDQSFMYRQSDLFYYSINNYENNDLEE